MFSINLNDYKKTKIYLQLFDVILKDLPINKEEFLLEHDITPSSYRLARKVEQNVGKSMPALRITARIFFSPSIGTHLPSIVI